MYGLYDSPYYKDIKNLELPRPAGASIGMFWLFFLVTALLSSIPTYLYTVYQILSDPSVIFASISGDLTAYTALLTEIMFGTGALLCQLYACLIPIGAAFFYIFFVVKRPVSYLGFYRKNAFLLYLGGFLVGVLLLALAIGIAALNGSITLSPAENPNYIWLFLFLLGFIIQGAEEEILFRGILMSSLLETQKPAFAILINSLFFALVHGANAGAQPLALINVFLFGVLLSLLVLRTGSIFASLALHTAWNFAEGCIFGTSVSGMPALPSWFVAAVSPDKTLTSGGAFGPEGGVAVTAVLIIALVILYLIPDKNRKKNSFKGDFAA